MSTTDAFRGAEDEYFRLKGQLATGRITHQQFEAALKALMLQDEQGRYWMLGVDSGKWYVDDHGTWIEAVPPGMEPAKPMTMPERGARPPAPMSFAPATPVPQKSNAPLLALIAVVALVGLGVGVYFLFFNNPNQANVALATPPNVALAITATASPAAAAASETPAPAPTGTETATPVPSQTPVPELVTSNVPDVQVAVVPVELPSPIAAKDFAAMNTLLAEKIAALNRAELKFIADMRATSFNGRLAGNAFPPVQTGFDLTDQDLKDIAGKAMDVAIFADELGEVTAKQDKGSPQAAASADAYLAIARNALSLAIDSQNLRQDLLGKLIPGAQGIGLIAEYGASLWNNEVTDGGTTGNPFTPLVNNSEPVQPLDKDAAVLTQPIINADNAAIWIAQSAGQTTKTVIVPPAKSPVSNPFDPNLQRSLTTADGQSDGNKAQQVAGAILAKLGATSTTSDPTKPTELQVPSSPVAVAEGGQIQAGNLPSFPKGKVTIVSQESSGDDPFLHSLDLNGTEAPSENGETKVQDAPSLVNLAITDIVLEQVNEKRAKDAFNTFEADVTYSFTIHWSTTLGAPRFPLDCVHGNHFDITQQSGTAIVHAKGALILFPGAEEAFCYASNNGNTLGFTSVRFLVGDAAQATQRAIQVETDSQALNATLTADAHGTESAQQTQAAATAQVIATMNALETEVGGTKTAEFKLTAAAFATKQALPPPEPPTPTVTPTFTPKVVDQLSHPGNVDGVSTHVVLERGHLYRFTFTGRVNLINPTKSASANDMPEHVNGVVVPANGVVVVEGTGAVAAITCGSGVPDPENPGAFGITVEDLGPI